MSHGSNHLSIFLKIWLKSVGRRVELYTICPAGRLASVFCNCSPAQGYFLPRECCERHNMHDQKIPALFRIECKGTEMVSLASKSYSAKLSDGSVKFSSKGLNKRALHNIHQAYKTVLKTGKSCTGMNRGLRTYRGGVYTYEQSRSAIPYFYVKRQVMADGVSTNPISIGLCPWNNRFVDIVNSTHSLYRYKSHTHNSCKHRLHCGDIFL